jgi:hypothetical protein
MWSAGENWVFKVKGVLLEAWKGKGLVGRGLRKSSKGGKYDQAIMYAYM